MITYGLLDKSQIGEYEDYLESLTEREKYNELMAYMGAFSDDTLVGVAAFLAEEYPVLVSVCVAEGEERKGIGSGLVESICDLLKEKGAPSLTAVVEEDSEDSEDSQELFLWRCGMNPTPSTYGSDITLKDAFESEILKAALKRIRKNKELISFKRLPSYLLNSAWSRQSDQRHMPPLSEFAIDKDISVAYRDNDRLLGWMVYSSDSTGITLEHAFVSSKSGKKLLLMEMLSKSLQLMKKKYPLETVVHMNFQNDVSHVIFQKLFEGDKFVGSQKMYWIDLNRQPERFDTFEISEDDGDQIFELGEQNKELGSGSMGAVPVMVQFTNEFLVCKGCRYCVYGDVLSCHKYDTKPEGVLDMESDCEKFHND